ncbi:MAG: hypothetical protein CM1200mP41_01790 [Gammaproteobacteria bacterium]|nr:MAG: hypothetical protein CM1200mP41_01790 [Gammaproteobacteria bacterium]
MSSINWIGAIAIHSVRNNLFATLCEICASGYSRERVAPPCKGATPCCDINERLSTSKFSANTLQTAAGTPAAEVAAAKARHRCDTFGHHDSYRGADSLAPIAPYRSHRGPRHRIPLSVLARCPKGGLCSRVDWRPSRSTVIVHSKFFEYLGNRRKLKTQQAASISYHGSIATRTSKCCQFFSTGGPATVNSFSVSSI